MNTTLEKRVEQLEHRLGSDDDFMLVVISFLACDDGLTGYSSVGRDRKWQREAGESVSDLRARIESELRAEGQKTYAICECDA